jgi:hypothetical protein
MKGTRAQVVLFGLALLLAGCGQVPRPGGLSMSRPAPAFRGQDADGRVVSLKDYRGKVVLLDFWRTG